MEKGLLHDYFGNFSMQGEKYYFHMKGSMWGEIKCTWGEIEMNVGKLIKAQISFLGGGDI